jgi:hypothetical protein
MASCMRDHISSTNILLLCGGLYGELYERPYNKVLSASFLPGAAPAPTISPGSRSDQLTLTLLDLCPGPARGV